MEGIRVLGSLNVKAVNRPCIQWMEPTSKEVDICKPPSQGTVVINGQRLPLMIAGDAAYPLQTWLMKAYPSPQQGDPSKARFNVRLGAARVCVEHAFGRLSAAGGEH